MIRSRAMASTGRRAGRSRLVTAVAAAAALGTLAACGGGGGAVAPENPIAEATVPTYYPAEYSQIIEGSKGEGGTLTIYSNTDQENWEPIFRDFRKKYPWVTTISANNLDSDEVFQRVLSEQATGSSPADILVSNAAQAWAEYGQNQDRLLAYSTPELTKLPAFATLMPNVYAMSVDPMTIAYNTALVPEPPTGLASLAAIVAKDPAKFQDKLTTRDVGGAFGFTVSNTFTQANPSSWATLEKLLPMARPETSSGTQTEKILSGEYLAGFFISGGPAYPVVDNSGGLFQVAFLDDGTVVLPRGIGIAPKAPHANTAKLFTDFVLSAEGQRAVAEGGLTSYRDDAKAAPGLHTYQEVVDKVGEKNVIFAKYSLVPDAQVQEFTKRWDDLLAR